MIFPLVYITPAVLGIPSQSLLNGSIFKHTTFGILLLDLTEYPKQTIYITPAVLGIPSQSLCSSLLCSQFPLYSLL